MFFDQRDRVAQRQIPPRRQSTRHFPSEQAAIKCRYLVIRSLDPTRRGKQRWAVRWKPALNAFAIMFEHRLFPNNQ